ncbi:MAG TPA: hypothetical protein VFJ29_02340 [Candidatus Kapabacteria bacterium]|nr:hypothetical protein [Candidatus Kapabacteria bacterium]
MAALIAAFTIAEVNVFAQEKSAPTKGQSTSQTLPPKSQGNNLKGKGAKKRVRKHFKRRRREHQRIKAAK